MKSLIVLGICFSLISVAAPLEKSKKASSAPLSLRLICKTPAEKKSSPQKMHFHYNLPLQFEPEDPTMPFGRQNVILGGRPVVQFYFEKSNSPAGERGENLLPMQCAFARRTVKANEPNQVQILISGNQITWMSQPLGQKIGSEKPTLIPTADWSFAYKSEQVFSVELDDLKTFVSTQMPKEL
jgi:hypothetical protein